MRHGRAKAARKTLQFFERHAGLKAPYHVLLDGNFVVAFFQSKLPIDARLARLLQQSNPSALRFCVSKTTLEELKQLSLIAKGDKKEMMDQAYRWAEKRATVLDEIPASSKKYDADLSAAAKDVLALVDNDKDDFQRYLLATQDEDLLEVARSLGSVPIIRLARGSVLVLENPSKAANSQAKSTEHGKWKVAATISEQEKGLVDLVKQQERRQAQADAPLQQRRKRKAKGPNPLSCKKKIGESALAGDKTKRKRRRKQKFDETSTAGFS